MGYRNKGYNFTITSSTAFDQKWSYGRNIFSNISLIVDEMFQNFLSRPNVRQPILTQYCDGQRVSCPNWMTQWGSKYLGDAPAIIGLNLNRRRLTVIFEETVDQKKQGRELILSFRFCFYETKILIHNIL